ncbi:MAG: glycosyltransferase [Siphonobacter sp.]
MKKNNMYNLAPILLFVYKRLDTLQYTVESLKANLLAKNSELYIYSDAYKSETDKKGVEDVRQFIKSIQGFKSVHIVESIDNKGLAKSIIYAVSEIINQYGKVIVLEDDLLLSSNFLTFMNKSLDFYENNPKVYSISGFMFDIDLKKHYSYDVFFTKRHCSWGWAMWKDRWNRIDWEVKDFQEFMDNFSMQKKFNDIGADLTYSLKRQQKGEINSWAIRCNYQQFKEQTYTVYPLKSKVDNLGFGDDATHTKQRFNKYKATLDRELKYEYSFPDDVFEEPILINKFKRKYSKLTRFYYYVLNKLFM